MPFLAAGCVDHGGASTDPSAVCCPGLTKWPYDAKNGVAYDGFMCWSATCAGEGQYSYQGAGCCSGLVSTGGICKPPTQQQSPTCATAGKVPLAGQACCMGLQKDAQGFCNAPSNTPGPCVMKAGESIICGVQDMYIYGGVAALVLLFAMGGKK